MLEIIHLINITFNIVYVKVNCHRVLLVYFFSAFMYTLFFTWADLKLHLLFTYHGFDFQGQQKKKVNVKSF